MSKRLLVNPGTQQAWEILLKPGVNRIGRNEGNDFQVPHASVSGAHCEIIVTENGITLKDLGSTNGTFVNRAPVKEMALQPGHHIQLGSVDMIFEAPAAGAGTSPASAPAPDAPPRFGLRMTGHDHSKPAADSAPAMASPPVPPPVTARPTGLRLSGQAPPAPAAPVAVASMAASAMEAEEAPPAAAPLAMGTQHCKFHPKTLARFYCGKCQKFFCDLCVGTRTGGGSGTQHVCRACASVVSPVQVSIERPQEQSFFRLLPGTFIYPLKGMGVFILLFAVVLFAALDFMGHGLLGWLFTIFALGYLFVFLQNIIQSTAAGDSELPGIPEMDGLFGAFLSFAGTVAMSFGIPIALGIWVVAGEQEGLGPFIIGTTILGCLYFPMAFLAVAMKDSAFAGNPLVVVPSILKIPGEYVVAALLMAGVFGVKVLGDTVMASMKSVGYSTRDMSVLFMTFGLRAAWSLLSVYLLAVNMRVLGLLYLTKKDKLEWF